MAARTSQGHCSAIFGTQRLECDIVARYYPLGCCEIPPAACNIEDRSRVMHTPGAETHCSKHFELLHAKAAIYKRFWVNEPRTQTSRTAPEAEEAEANESADLREQTISEIGKAQHWYTDAGPIQKWRLGGEKGPALILMILIGCGAVGCAVLELIPLCRLLPALGALVIIEPGPVAGLPVLRGLTYRHIRVALTQANLAAILDPLLARATPKVVFDCSVNVDALAVMARCHAAGSLYLNCSQEDWETEAPEVIDPRPAALLKRALCSRIWAARAAFASGPTMLADEGMNPGIVSLFALRGLEDMAKAAKDAASVADMQAGRYAAAAERLGVRAIHITERDTQTLRRPRPRGEFWNTWSSIGLAAEALDPIQMGRGTHEAPPTAGAVDVRNMRLVPQRGMDAAAWSYSPARRGPGRRYAGYLISHGEANTLSAALSRPGYRPSVYFVYQPCLFGRASLAELRTNGYRPPTGAAAHVATLPELRSGYDAVGALIWSDRHPAWWSGTVLDNRDMAPLGFKYSGPTTVQVAIALVAALKWMLAHPAAGLITPEDLPYAEILRDCEPYLGRVLSGPVPVARPSSLRLEAFLLAPVGRIAAQPIAARRPKNKTPRKKRQPSARSRS